MMKKLLILWICILLAVGLIACDTADKSGGDAATDGAEDAKQVVRPADEPQPEPTYVTIHFVISDELYTFTAPADITVQAGTVPQLPLPEGGVPIDAHDYLCWFADEELNIPYDNAPITQDTTLYLYEVGKTYNIVYELPDGLTIEGDCPTTYQYNVDAYTNKGQELPTIKSTGYERYLYCKELEGYFTRVPLSAGRDLTFIATGIAYDIRYESGLKNTNGVSVPMSAVDNPNPTKYGVVDGTLVLKDASYEGKEFDHWVVMVDSTTKTFVIDGQEVTLDKNGTILDKLSYEMIRWGQFTVVAKWK